MSLLFWAIVVLVIIVVIYWFVPDMIHRRRLTVMLAGDLAKNRAEIAREFRQIKRKTARDYVNQAKFERITTGGGRGALEAALAARTGTGDAEYIRDNVIGYFDDDTYIMQMVQHINMAAGGGGSGTTGAITMPTGPVTAAVTSDALESAAEYRPDTQNAHDSAVNRGIRDGLARIGRANDASAEVRDIRAYVARCGAKTTPALNTLSKMLENTTPIGTYGMREDEILAAVWARARHQRNSANAANADNIRDAVIDALADASSSGPVAGTTVCANGRVSRIFGALAGLDYDPAVSTLGDMGMWRNQIFNEVKDVIVGITEREKDSPDHEIACAARAYAGEDSGDCVSTTKFEAILVREIHDTVYKYVDDIGGVAAAGIIKECNTYAGV